MSPGSTISKGGKKRGRAGPARTARVRGSTAGERNWSRGKLEKLDELLAVIEAKLVSGEYRASIGDFIRLLQLRKELEDERPREITITWVEPSGEENAPAR